MFVGLKCAGKIKYEAPPTVMQTTAGGLFYSLNNTARRFGDAKPPFFKRKAAAAVSRKAADGGFPFLCGERPLREATLSRLCRQLPFAKGSQSEITLARFAAAFGPPCRAVFALSCRKNARALVKNRGV